MSAATNVLSRRRFLASTGFGVAALAGPVLARDAKARPPNIILFLTDDQGWTDTSVPMMKGRPDSGSDFYRTPALERLAREGMVFSSAYSPAPVCSPTRHSIQFGKTPARLHNTCHVRGAADCRDEMSIARMLKMADPAYAAAHFGKWGLSQSPGPAHFGYDRSDGRTNNFHGDWRALDDRRGLPEDDPKRIFSLTRRATAFMEEQARKGRPFYLQVSHYALHVQHAALAETIEKVRRRPRGAKCRAQDYQDPPPPLNGWMVEYAAMIEDMDTGLGTLLKAIDRLGIADNTYVFFLSDNGGGFRGNEPLRGGKGQCWEGGIRVPMVVRGTGIKAGTYCDVPVAGWDFFPTFSDLAGNRRPLPAGIDGGSLRPLLENGGQGEVKRPLGHLVFHFPFWTPFGAEPVTAIREGDWKLLKMWTTGERLLFNLAEDLGETRNLADAKPDKVNDLHAKLTAYLQAVGAEDWREIRATQGKHAGGLDIRRRTDNYLKEAEQDGAEKLRIRIEQLKGQLADQNSIRRQTVHSQAPDANRAWARANAECVFLREVIEALQERLKRNGR